MLIVSGLHLSESNGIAPPCPSPKRSPSMCVMVAAHEHWLYLDIAAGCGARSGPFHALFELSRGGMGRKGRLL